MSDPTYQHRNLGREFEQMLERSHEAYATLAIAAIKKHPVEWKYTSFEAFRLMSSNRQDLVAKTNTGRYIARIRSYVDFSGVASGRFIAFDAKQVSRYNFPLADLRSHQLNHLVAAEKAGGIAGLMIRFTSYKRIFFVRANYVGKVNAAIVDGGKKSISIDDCVANGTEIHAAPGIEVDWYRALIKGGK